MKVELDGVCRGGDGASAGGLEQVLCSGQLMKGHPGALPRWKTKFVQLYPGRLRWAPDEASAVAGRRCGEVMLGAASRVAHRYGDCAIEVRGGSRASARDASRAPCARVPVQVSSAGSPGSARLWRARDAMERGRWLLAFERAAATGISAGLANEVRPRVEAVQCVPVRPDPGRQVRRCAALRDRIGACRDGGAYARVLTEQFMSPLLVSMAWVRNRCLVRARLTV